MNVNLILNVLIICISLIVKTNADSNYWKPSIGMTWNWILNADSSEINEKQKVDILGIDLFDHDKDFIKKLKKKNHKIICYFSAGTLENNRPDTNDFQAVPNLVMNKMEKWDEYYLNIKNPKIKELMEKRLDLAKEKGCDAIEPDNVDIYLDESVKKWNETVTEGDQMEYDIWLSNEAQKRGLAIALKNDIGNAKFLEPYFDFAINEDCYAFDECNLYSDSFISNNKPVFVVAYGSGCDEDFLSKVKASVYGKKFSVIIKDPNRLVKSQYLSYTPENGESFFDMCKKEKAMLSYSITIYNQSTIFTILTFLLIHILLIYY